MNVNVGKFLKRLIGRKQSGPTKVVRKVAPQLEPKKHEPRAWTPTWWIGKHNALQAEKAKQRRANRVKNRMRRKNRKINRKRGKK